MVGAVSWAGSYLLLGLEFKLGRIILTGLTLSQAQPNWVKFGEIRAFQAESQNLARDSSKAGDPGSIPDIGTRRPLRWPSL
jgi:hypothetical protein